MLVSTLLVLMMSVPGLALFYGGLVRTKNMLSVLMQVFMIVSIVAVIWCCWGYSEAFTSGTTPFVRRLVEGHADRRLGVDLCRDLLEQRLHSLNTRTSSSR